MGTSSNRVIREGLFKEVTSKLGLKNEKDPARQRTTDPSISTRGRQSFTRSTPSKLIAPAFFPSVQEKDFASKWEREFS